MSGIAGIIRLDGAPADARPLAGGIGHRGPDGVTGWSSGHVALVHALLRTTAEDAGLVVDDDLVVSADARIDNGTSIVDAWRRWGESCVTHLEGDFAFSVWDRRTNTLFCARDRFGVKQFVYALLPGKLFAFASDVRALLALPEIPRDLDDRHVREFLDVRFEQNEATFYRAVRRLPGGSTLTLRDGAVSIRGYWSLRDVKPLRLRGGDAAYAEGYREHFLRAVRERMRATGPTDVGAMLSGGLDSSAIACVARDELRSAGAPPLPVFCWTFSDAMEADEREFQEIVVAAGGMRPIILDSAANGASPWSDLEALLPEGPPFAPNHYLNTGMAKLARSIGVKVLLDGLAGDLTVSRGASRFVELFTRGRLLTLRRELRALARRRGTSESLPRLFAANVAFRLAPSPIIRLWSWMRRREYRRPPLFLSVQAEQLSQFESAFMAEGMELSDRMVAWLGVEGRYPFLDRRLVEYCLSLPSDQKLADGYTRIVARRAMEGIVPDAVRWRAGKGAPGLHAIHAMRTHSEQVQDVLLRDAEALERWADIDALRSTQAGLTAGLPVDFQALIRLWAAVALGLWLRRQ
jgi:asparagine synthase (glutamine-hydrolysing)